MTDAPEHNAEKISHPFGEQHAAGFWPHSLDDLETLVERIAHYGFVRTNRPTERPGGHSHRSRAADVLTVDS